jgi:hypothetical protein
MIIFIVKKALCGLLMLSFVFKLKKETTYLNKYEEFKYTEHRYLIFWYISL